ncbi:hypothetical protein B0H17DRAFT_271998 [Mycena rosella]|uniref:Uncharacterized protein n=1 Tax=Mycena rosella TaxID=1033263 RepID=A0AAD7GL78_MYCRO|nr:hypothetical protein B0H17DRAFT_271998 [Mycena rosella]
MIGHRLSADQACTPFVLLLSLSGLFFSQPPSCVAIMGQRHQVFIVARVVARNETVPRYRCVGAYHHQWCYGRLPLMATKRFFTLIKQKDNAEIIKEEIRAIQGKYDSGEKLPKAPCPYSLFLLASAWCVDLENRYASGGSFENGMLDAWMGSTEGDNNDGITVIDITEPTDPSYCFVSTFGLEAAVNVEGRVPLSAEQYARAYYPVPKGTKKEESGVKETEEDVQKKIDSLRHERMMTLDVLVEAWPREYRPSVQTLVEDPAPASTNSIPSLADLTLKPAVEHGIQTGETDELEALVWMPGKAGLIKSVLRTQNPFPDSGLPLLAKVVEHESGSDKTVLDLSGLPLSDSQIVSLLTGTLSETKDSIELLKFSYNHNITVDVLPQVLSATPMLRRLVLLDTSISDEQIRELLAKDAKLFHTLGELVHPALLSWPALYPPAFQYVTHNGQSTSSAALAVFTPATLIQSLTDYLSPIADLAQFEMFSFLGSSLVHSLSFRLRPLSECGHYFRQPRHSIKHPSDPFKASAAANALIFKLRKQLSTFLNVLALESCERGGSGSDVIGSNHKVSNVKDSQEARRCKGDGHAKATAVNHHAG